MPQSNRAHTHTAQGTGTAMRDSQCTARPDSQIINKQMFLEEHFKLDLEKRENKTVSDREGKSSVILPKRKKVVHMVYNC